MDQWNIRTLDNWNNGTLEHLNTGTLERWNIRTFEHSTFNQHFLTSITLILFRRLRVTLVTSIASKGLSENLKKWADM